MPKFRAILLDAVGTTIHPAEDVAQTYFEYGRKQGSRLSVEEVRSRFHQAFRRADALDLTSEEIERARWQALVREVFSDLSDTEGLFHDLWQYYAQPSAWRVYPDVTPCLDALSARGLSIILASNFDARLRSLVAGLPELQGITRLAISSEVGWKKGHTFFRKVLCDHGLTPQEAVAVGDDVAADYQGATAAGIASFLLDRTGSSPEPYALRTLTDLLPNL